jgi:hypothetical protein
MAFDDVRLQIAFRLKSRKVQEELEGLVSKIKSEAKIEYTKEGEALKPAPRPEGGFPMMPANEKANPAGEKPAEEKSDKSAK